MRGRQGMATTEAAQTSADAVLLELGKGTKRLLIDGEWVEAISGKTFDTLDPATGERLAAVAHGEDADTDRGVRAARRAFDSGPWASMTPADRSRIIWHIEELIEANLEELALLESLDNGKPLAVARAADIPAAAAMF